MSSSGGPIKLWYHLHMDDKITIIEGPTPQFIHVDEDWARGIAEGPMSHHFRLTNLRTFNGSALIERCYRAWHTQGMMYLEYRDEMGLTLETPILAARSMESPEGQVLQLWVRMDEEEEPEPHSGEEE
ncbi:MAG: hypothetical protein C0391_00155 [Anaerolinea sp.]|nr:hypothetical protein [Anaerolinea sp.]